MATGVVSNCFGERGRGGAVDDDLGQDGSLPGGELVAQDPADALQQLVGFRTAVCRLTEVGDIADAFGIV